jgi:hypothetical protein
MFFTIYFVGANDADKGTISYPNYKFSFTIWALGRYAAVWGDERIHD